MSDAGDLDDLVAYVARSSGLDPSQARRIVDDVLNYLGAVSYTHLTLPTIYSV